MKEFFYTLIVAPGFEDNTRKSGLFWDTEYRLYAAVSLYKYNRVSRIIVGGGKLRKMKKSFAFLMKEFLISNGIPKDIIYTEEDTYDTPSQFLWIKKNEGDLKGEVVFITDSAQAGHAKALLKGFNIQKCTVLSIEHIQCKMSKIWYWVETFKDLHRSPYWWYWVVREKILELFTRFFDPRGELISKLTSKRKK